LHFSLYLARKNIIKRVLSPPFFIHSSRPCCPVTPTRWLQLACPGKSPPTVKHGRPCARLGVEDNPNNRGPPSSLTLALLSFPSRGHWPVGPGPAHQCCAPRRSPNWRALFGSAHPPPCARVCPMPLARGPRLSNVLHACAPASPSAGSDHVR
jgi:hypothetical protein